MTTMTRGKDTMNPSGFFAVAPSTVMVDEEFDLRVKVLGELYYVGTGCRRGVGLRSPFNLSPRDFKYMRGVHKLDIESMQQMI